MHFEAYFVMLLLPYIKLPSCKVHAALTAEPYISPSIHV